MLFFIIKTVTPGPKFIFYSCFSGILFITSQFSLAGGFFSKPSSPANNVSPDSKPGPLVENIFSGDTFEFIILEFDDNDKSLIDYSRLDNSILSVTVTPNFNRGATQDLYQLGLWFDYTEKIKPAAASERNKNGLYGTVRSYFGRRTMLGSSKPLASSAARYEAGPTHNFENHYGVLPVLTLTYFLHDKESFYTLPVAARPFLVTAPLMSENVLLADYMGVNHNSEGAIRSVYTFGSMPGLKNDIHFLTANGKLQQNIASVTRTETKPGEMLLLIGLTPSGKWGAFALILPGKYIVGIRRELAEAISHKKDDFDSPPPPGGAAGNIAIPSL